MREKIIQLFLENDNQPMTEHQLWHELKNPAKPAMYQDFKLAFECVTSDNTLERCEQDKWKLPTVYIWYVSGKLVAVKRRNNDLLEQYGDNSQYTTHHSDGEDIYIFNSGLVISVREVVVT